MRVLPELCEMFLSSSTSRLTEQDRGLSEGIRGAASCGNLGRYLVPPRQEEEKDGRKGREGGRERRERQEGRGRSRRREVAATLGALIKFPREV